MFDRIKYKLQSLSFYEGKWLIISGGILLVLGAISVIFKNFVYGDMLTRPIEAGASCSREATLSDITGYPRVPRGSNDL